MSRARTLEEYRELLRQAFLEVEELEQTSEFDEMSEVDNLVGPIRQVLEDLQARLDAGTYEFGGPDLDFMPLVETYDVDVIPFRHLLQRLNWTHVEGLDESNTTMDGV